MKIARFFHAGEPAWGVVHDGGVVPLAHVGAQAGAGEILAAARSAGAATAGLLPLAEVSWLAPLTPSATVYCVGINYRAHAQEAGRETPPFPSLFIRRQASLVGPGQALCYPEGSGQFDFEGELAVVIGRAGRHLAPQEALAHVAAYTCLNDGSARDFQKHSVTAGKNFEGSGACGPWWVTADEVGDPARLTLATYLNGQEMQRTCTGEMIYPIADVVSYVSRFARLQPGDVISTGTPAGVGAARTPPLWLQPGDRVSVHITHIGQLENVVV